LAELVCDKSHISIFANNKKHKIVDVQNAAVALEKSCFEKLFELRGQQLNRQVQQEAQKTIYCGNGDKNKGLQTSFPPGKPNWSARLESQQVQY
jgi:hypothetical protein